MKKVYIVLMHTKTLPARFIKFFTGYAYTHVGLSLDESCEEIYSFGRKQIHSFLKSGFTKEKKNGAFFQKFRHTRCQIYEIKTSDNCYETLKNNLIHMELHKDLYKYDFLGIFLRYFKIPYFKENYFVCSYFVAKVLVDAEILHFAKEPYFVEPKDFSKFTELKKIYEGKYISYQNEVIEFSRNKINV